MTHPSSAPEPAEGRDPALRGASEGLRAYFERFNETGQAMLEALHPEIEWHLRADLPDARTLRGHQEVERLNADWTQAFEDLRIEPTGVAESRGKTIASIHLHGRIRGSGQAVDMDEVWVIGWREGKIIEIREYNTREEALSAVEAEA